MDDNPIECIRCNPKYFCSTPTVLVLVDPQSSIRSELGTCCTVVVVGVAIYRGIMLTALPTFPTQVQELENLQMDTTNDTAETPVVTRIWFIQNDNLYTKENR